MSFYEKMKERCKKDFDENFHFINLFTVLSSMFEWKNLPETINPLVLEKILISEGAAGVGKINGQLYTGTGSFCGDIKNFVPIRYQFVNVGIGDFIGEIGIDCAVCWNNAFHMPDLSLFQYASILTEIDVSERCNVFFSRLVKIPRVKDTKEKTAIEECLKDILNGKFSAFVSKNIQESLLSDHEQHPENRFLDLTNVSDIDKLQYLNQYRDNVVKRFFQMYGQGMQTTAKLAQQTTDELHGNDAVSLILPNDRLKQRKKFCEEMNRIFGLNVSVDFSECWKESVKEMHETYSDGTKESGVKENGTDENN